MVSCSDDKSIRLWECDKVDGNGEWMNSCKMVDVHKHPIYTIDWSHEHGFIASGGGDNAIVISNMSTSDGSRLLGQESRVANAHNGDINCVRWNPKEGDLSIYLVSAGDDGMIKIWKWCQ